MYEEHLPNYWLEHPAEDPRFQGLLDISWAISDAFDSASGQQGIHENIEMNPEIYPYWTPLRLARELEAAARRIREFTHKVE